MAENPSHAAFLRKVGERHRQLKNDLDEMLTTLVGNDNPKKLSQASALASALEHFGTRWTFKSQPPWIGTLHDVINPYVHFKGEGDWSNKLLRLLIKLQPSVVSWDFESTSSINIDNVYRDAYDQSQIPSLFDKLIDLLGQLIDTGEIDSYRAITKLRELIELLKKNRNGSYVATWTTWQFVKTAIPNILHEYVKSSKTVGPLMKGLQTTIEQLEVKWPEVHDKMRQAMASKLTLEPPQISPPMLIAGDTTTIEGKAEEKSA